MVKKLTQREMFVEQSLKLNDYINKFGKLEIGIIKFNNYMLEQGFENTELHKKFKELFGDTQK